MDARPELRPEWRRARSSWRKFSGATYLWRYPTSRRGICIGIIQTHGTPSRKTRAKKWHGAVWPSPAPLQCPSGLPRPRGHVGTSLGCLVGVWCGHGALWWPTGRGLGRALLVCRGPAVASSGPLWCPWGKPRPLQWPPDPQGPWQRPPVGWGWYGAVCRACECRNAHSKWAPTALFLLFSSCGH